MRKHLDSLGRGLTPTRSDLSNRVPSLGEINWKKITPQVRLELIRHRLADATKDLLEDLDDARDIKKGLPNPKRGEKRKEEKEEERRPKKKKHRKRDRDNKDKPNPSPTPDNKEKKRRKRRPPKPRDVESPPRPPLRKKETWDSRVGYFMTLSDITWYEDAPQIHESPFVDIHFTELENQHLRLRPGDIWVSDWYETGVIRGLNIDVVGKHNLNYSKNGDFEV